MNSIHLNQSRCPADHPCPVLRVCSAGAVTQKSPFSAPEIDESKCTLCGKCTKFCPYGAFQAM